MPLISNSLCVGLFSCEELLGGVFTSLDNGAGVLCAADEITDVSSDSIDLQ